MGEEKLHPKSDNRAGEPEPQHAAGIVSHEGQQRTHNEDSVLETSLPPAKAEQSQSMKVVAVADGAGGMAAGQLASKLTVRAIELSVKDGLPDTSNDPYGEWLVKAVRNANYLVYSQAQQERRRMASTLVIALIEGDQVHIANVGDSRAYLVNEGGLRRITRDHSAIEELLDAGLITYEQIKGHPFEHVLTRAIGPEEDVEPDLYTERVHSGDRLLLCTDGLTNMVPEDEIYQIVVNAPDAQTAAQELIDAANRAGGKDNITAAVVEIRS